MKNRTMSLGILLICVYFFSAFSAWAGDTELRVGADLSLHNTDSDADGLPDWWEVAFFGNLSQMATTDPDRDGSTNLTEFKADTNPADGREAAVPTGNFFNYDAFGRIVEKRTALE